MVNHRLPDRGDVKVPASIKKRHTIYAAKLGIKFDIWLGKVIEELRAKEPESPLVN